MRLCIGHLEQITQLSVLTLELFLFFFAGLMPYEMKDPRYVRDPKLFDPFRRK